jgi:hypothetical protein
MDILYNHPALEQCTGRLLYKQAISKQVSPTLYSSDVYFS